MPDEVQVELVKQGATIWNQWRIENPGVRPSLSFARLSGCDLRRVDLRSADLGEANLSGANLIGANLQSANLVNALLNSAKLSETDLSFAALLGSDLSDAVLSEANLVHADLYNAELTYANLAHAKLTGVNLSRANLSSADLSGADLMSANLSNAKLAGANLRGADIRYVDFGRADLDQADLSLTTIGWTTFGNNDLSRVIGLDSARHLGPSTLGIDTIYLSKGEIPEAFLRGTGVPDNLITYLTPLTQKAFEFYSCFISYSSKNQEFAERLYADLQSNGVRCWYAPEDLRIGERIRVGIEESIRLHDKLLLILSKQSVASNWVEDEVEIALELERKHKRTVLFPVRIDSAVAKIEGGWPADVRRTRHIGDFRNWKNHDAYVKAFRRLLRDLKADDSAANSDRDR